MANIRLIKRRIKSAKNIAQITKAMELVAAAKMKKAQAAALSGKLYAQKIYEMVTRLATRTDYHSHELLMTPAPTGKRLVVLLSTNKGLCGGLNTSLFRFFMKHYSGNSNYDVITLGKKGADFVTRLGHGVKADFSDTTPWERVVPALVSYLTEQFLSGQYDAVDLVSNEFLSAVKQMPKVKTVLPLTITPDAADATTKEGNYEFLIEPTLKNPNILANGIHEQTFRFSGHFWTEALDFKKFPFQTMKVPIRFEIAQEDFALNGRMPTSLVADPNQPDLVGSLIEIPGLEFEGARLDPFLHQFADDSSFSTAKTTKTFSQVRILTVFKTHPITAIGQWLIPILIVMLTVYVAPTVSGRLSDVRIAIPSAALLTLVVMQQSYETTIPQLSYLTFLDLVYLWCYTVTVALFILFVWSANQFALINTDSPDHEQRLGAITARIKRIDRRFQSFSLLGTSLFMIWAYLR